MISSARSSFPAEMHDDNDAALEDSTESLGTRLIFPITP